MPQAALRPCSDCRRALTRSRYCQTCEPRHANHGWQDRGTSTERGYGTVWRKLRAAVLRRDKGLCQPCLEQGRIRIAIEVDHITPKAKGGTDDMGNLQAICKPCHRAKTVQERG